MKEWLKHKYGYINIDDENVYVTKTGNWSEISKLQEKNHRRFIFLDGRTKLKIGIYLFVQAGLILYVFVSNIVSGDFLVSLVILTLLIAYSVFSYLIPEYGSSFVIPKNKILTIQIKASEAHITFLDANNKSSSNHFRGLNTKGLEIIDRVKKEMNLN